MDIRQRGSHAERDSLPHPCVAAHQNSAEFRISCLQQAAPSAALPDASLTRAELCATASMEGYVHQQSQAERSQQAGRPSRSSIPDTTRVPNSGAVSTHTLLKIDLLWLTVQPVQAAVTPCRTQVHSAHHSHRPGAVTSR